MFRGHLIFLLLSMKFAVISLNFWKTFGCVYCVFLNQKKNFDDLVILRQTKNHGCSEAEQENRIRFHVVKNKKPREKTKLSYSTKRKLVEKHNKRVNRKIFCFSKLK